MTSLRLGTYELIERLHQGGLAEVFLARQIGRTPPDPITLKRIDAEVVADPKRGAHIPDRAREALILEHPGILGMLEVGEAAGSTYIATEYLAGRPLRALLKTLAKKKERLELPLALLIGRSICEALVHAHAAGGDGSGSPGVVHGALSPDSIRIGLGGEVKLEDFGSMPATWKSRSVSKNERLGFLSPEQLAGAPLTPATDLYALGLVLYELAMGRRLYGPAPRALRLQELLDGAELPLEAELPDALLDLLRQALARKPEERFQSAKALLEALRRIEDASPGATGSADALAALMARIFPDAHSTEAQRQTRLLKGPPLSMSSPSSPHPEDPASTPDAAVEEPSAKVAEETSEHASAGDAGDDSTSTPDADGREAAAPSEDETTSPLSSASDAGQTAKGGQTADAGDPDASSGNGAGAEAAEAGSGKRATSDATATGKDSEQDDAPASAADPAAASPSSTDPKSPAEAPGEGVDATAGDSASASPKGDNSVEAPGPTADSASEPSTGSAAAVSGVVPAIAPVASATSALSDASKPASTPASASSASQPTPAASGSAKPAPAASASSGSASPAAAAPGSFTPEKPAPTAAASSSAPKPTPTSAASSSAPKPAPSAAASSSAPKSAPSAAASSSAPKSAPTAAASSSAPKSAPTAAASSSAPKPAPASPASSSAPKPAPTATASSSAPKPAPTATASSSAPKPAPTAAASSSAPKPAPSATASSSAPKPAPSAAASSSEPEPVTAETALPGTPISATSEVSLPDYRDFDDDDDDEDERTQLITTELLVSSLPAAEVAAVSAAPAAPSPSGPPRKTAVVTRPSSTPRATGTRPAAGGSAPAGTDSSRPASQRTGTRPGVSDPGSGPRRAPTRPPSGEVRAAQGNRRTASRTSIPAVGRSSTPAQETRGAGPQRAPPRDTGAGRPTGSGRSPTPASRPARRPSHTELPAAGAGKGTPIPRTFSASHPAFDAIKEAESFPSTRPGAAQPKMEILAASPASAPVPEPAQRPLVPVPSSRPAPRSPVRSAATLSGSLLDSVPKSLWVVAGLILLLLMLGLGFSLRSSPDSEVVVHVTPVEGALITLDGRQLQSGQPIALPPGEYELVAIAEGYQRYSQRITVFEDAEQAIYPITLQSDALRGVPTTTGAGAENAGTFTVRFTTTTPGVEIWVEGRSVGKAPEATAVLAIGRPHHYEARAQGYEATMGTVGSFGDPEVSVQLTLQPAVDRVRNPNAPRAGGTGRLVVDTEPTGAEIYVNGVPTGRRTPISSVDPLTLPAGKHRLRFAHGDRVSRLQNVTLERGQTIMLDDVAIDQAR